jgi:hypothetical protein
VDSDTAQINNDIDRTPARECGYALIEETKMVTSQFMILFQLEKKIHKSVRVTVVDFEKKTFDTPFFMRQFLAWIDQYLEGSTFNSVIIVEMETGQGHVVGPHLVRVSAREHFQFLETVPHEPLYPFKVQVHPLNEQQPAL